MLLCWMSWGLLHKCKVLMAWFGEEDSWSLMTFWNDFMTGYALQVTHSNKMQSLKTIGIVFE
jgi:hypothetical protein